MKHWVEFFEGDNERLSMPRLTCFMAFFPATYLLVKHGTENMLLYYLGAFVLGYLGGKAGDTFTSIAQIKADGPPPPDITVPDAGTVNVKADGNVSVTRKRKKR